MSESGLPKPTGFYYPEDAKVFYGNDGRVYHEVVRMTDGGSKVTSVRPLAMTIEEAREARLDFYHPTLGLIWNGYKLASDRTAEDRAKDTTESVMKPGAAVPA